jgi:hypothetical protein
MTKQPSAPQYPRNIVSDVIGQTFLNHDFTEEIRPACESMQSILGVLATVAPDTPQPIQVLGQVMSPDFVSSLGAYHRRSDRAPDAGRFLVIDLGSLRSFLVS